MPTAPNYLASNISFLAARDGLSLIDLASETGVDPSTVYRLADTNNSRQPRARTLRGIADFFHVDPFALLEQDLRTTPYVNTKEKPKPDALGDFSPSEKNERIPLIKITNPNAVDPGLIACFSDDFGLPENIAGFVIERWICRPYGINGEFIVAFEMVGDAMAPTFLDKDILFISHFESSVFKDSPHQIVSGEYIFGKINIDGKTAITVRKTVRNDFGEISLIAENPRFTGSQASLLNSLGRVVGLSRSVTVK